MLEPLIDFVFPPRCPLCGAGVSSQTGLCADCWSELAIPGEPCCDLCSRPFGEDVATGSTCAPCLADPPRHDGIAAATLYNDASRKLVLAFKHGSRLGLAKLMARLMAARLASEPRGDWVIVPVPLHRWRLWRRGYNQAAILAQELAQITGGTVSIDALERRKSTAALGGLGRLARRRELSGAIRLAERRRQSIRGKSVLLVDDVLTSGATSDVCVSALKRGGASRVVVTCFARVLDEALDLR
ncbi:ComF family protein [Novosphingobium sp. 9U]|uniref:ComF family protein n=1 Tax=Novosphingobium sp. 9U TaxID=2653158 RepID=UPI00352F4B9D